VVVAVVQEQDQIIQELMMELQVDQVVVDQEEIQGVLSLEEQEFVDKEMQEE
tara:strand:+ start:126 stop:281 length:156 start_codon:yes stop_codon:yes gene_type:complete